MELMENFYGAIMKLCQLMVKFDRIVSAHLSLYIRMKYDIHGMKNELSGNLVFVALDSAAGQH